MRPLWRGRTLFLSFSAAVFGAVYLLPVSLWPWLGLALLAPAGFFLWRRRSWGALVCLGLAAGLLWCGAYRAVFFAPAQALDGRRSQVRLYLSETPTPSDYGAYVSGWVVQPGKAPVQATLYGDEDLLDLGPGDRVEVLANCSQTALRPEGRFTARATRGVFLRLIAQGPMEVTPAQGVPWWCLPRWWGEQLAESIRAAFPQDVSGLLAALAAGDRSGIDPALNTDLARSGVSHLVAVSGMHVCFLVGFLTLFVGHDPRRRALVCAPALIFFALAVGGSPSVLRACCLQLSVLLADLLGRETERWTSLFGTLAFLLLLDPFSAANVSLQLSFAAVAGIGLVTPRVSAALARFRFRGDGLPARVGNALARFARELLATTLGALSLSVPLSVYYFGTLSLAAPLTNLLVLPVVSVLFAGTLVTGLLGLAFPAAAAGVGGVLAWLARYVLWVVRWVAALPHSAVTLTDLYYPAALLGVYALVLLALLRRDRRRGGWVFVLCALVLVAGSILFTRLTFRAGELTAAVLDVGQGQSVVLSSGGQTALVDCGGNSYQDPGDVCADYLNARGETRVDKLILTHYHADHTNGLTALFRRLEVGEVVMPQMEHDEDTQTYILSLAREEGANVTWLNADTQVSLGQAALTLYAPLGDGGANEEGLSVLVSTGDFHMLITGDMNTVVEERLAQHARLPRCQVLVAGHHGSRHASGQALLEATDPQTAVISVGENDYGHPAPETLERYQDRKAEVYRTDRLGTVTIQVQ